LLDGKYPATVGLFFSLGHSTVVILVSLGVAFTSNLLPESFQGSQEIGQLISTSVSAFFLLLIGAINLRVLYHTFQDWKKVRRGQQVDQSITASVVDVSYPENDQTPIGTPCGFTAICCPTVFRMIDSPWKMYPLGFVFGFGFDTASEVALLGIAALTSHQEIPAIVILLLALLFTAGMCLVDTLDSIFMTWAYGWAFVSPAKKIFYNMFLTGTSACVAFFVGTVEVGGILVDKLKLSGSFWSSWKALCENFEILGIVIIGIFSASFLSSVIMLKMTSNSEEQVQMEASEQDFHLAKVEAETLNEKTPLIGDSVCTQKLSDIQATSAICLGPCICHEKFHDRAQRSQMFFQQQ
jgi:high-affinity nickel-transport protein